MYIFLFPLFVTLKILLDLLLMLYWNSTFYCVLQQFKHVRIVYWSTKKYSSEKEKKYSSIDK
jgi:hypothetical protein